MTEYLRTMLRITDPDGSRAFYAALGFTFSRDMDIVRDGQLEATNYFYSLGDSENVLELTFNHDGRAYELGSAYGHITIGVDNLDDALAQLKEQGIEPEREPYRVREGGVRKNAEERMAAPKRENRSAPSFSAQSCGSLGRRGARKGAMIVLLRRHSR